MGDKIQRQFLAYEEEKEEWQIEDQLAESLPGKPISHHGRWATNFTSQQNSPE